ncbi:MAG: DUF1904 family protein [Candidatus Heteroscillospira sp.]|jgi:hypothetical protein
MPQISMRGMSPQLALELAPEVKKAVVSATGTDEKYVTTEYICSFQMDDSGMSQGFSKVDILWLSGRSQELHDKTAEAVTNVFRQRGIDRLQIAFINLPPSHFYDDGTHY